MTLNISNRSNQKHKFRHWIAWLIASIWVIVLFGGLVAAHVRPSTAVNVAVNTKTISFRTDAGQVLGTNNEDQLIVAGIQFLRAQLSGQQSISIDSRVVKLSSFELKGGPFASCSFYRVRSGPLELGGSSVLVLGKLSAAKSRSFSLQAHGPLSGTLSTRPQGSSSPVKPGFECTGVQINGVQAGQVAGQLSVGGADSISFSTAPDSRLDFSLNASSPVGDTQIRVLDAVRFSEIDHLGGEKSVLLNPPAKVTFETVNSVKTLDEADLLEVIPNRDFYLRDFTVGNGIQLSLHGIARDVRAGAGSTDLRSVMPSVFDHLNNETRLFAVIAGIVALIVGYLEKVGLLPQK
jgi:hypothetical protein